MNTWFDVDKAGLAKLLAGRPKAFLLFELLQNAWDEECVTRVDVCVKSIAGTRNVTISVVDDAPDGFADLRDAYTLFAESRKKGNAAKRGRFNLGEKLVLALSKSALIESTRGSVHFTEEGIRRNSRQARAKGSMFQATVPMTKAEKDEMLEAVRRLIVPTGIVTTIDGVPLPERTPLTTFDVVLPTVVADNEGVLRKTTRKTQVRTYEPMLGETPTLFEMGIPVVETGDRFHVDVSQKVPLNMDRDNVTPAYLRAVRVAVLNAAHEILSAKDSSETWVREACGDERASVAAVRTAVTLRFGDNAVRFDPSDPEANKRSQAEGRPVVYGGNLTPAEWANVNRAGVLPTAGKVTPSPKPYSPDGDLLNVLPASEWTAGMRQVAGYAIAIGSKLLDCDVQVSIASNPDWPYHATYGKGKLVFNLARCGRGFFEQGITDDVNELLIHEFGHHYAGDHLSTEYYRALCKVGARMLRLALTSPAIFQ